MQKSVQRHAGSIQRDRWESAFEVGLGNVLSIVPARISVYYVRAASLAVGVDLFDTCGYQKIESFVQPIHDPCTDVPLCESLRLPWQAREHAPNYGIGAGDVGGSGWWLRVQFVTVTVCNDRVYVFRCLFGRKRVSYALSEKLVHVR